MTPRRVQLSVVCAALLTIAAYAQTTYSAAKISLKNEKSAQKNDSAATAVDNAIRWLVSVQGQDGGWGQDGGETSYVRQGERLESSANDVANTALAAQALLRAGNTPKSGHYQQSLHHAVNFILKHVEKSASDGLAITDIRDTQIQRKLGPYIDTFLTSKLLADLDGKMGNAEANARVRRALEKCVAKIQKNQLNDGSWNISGGWAPILGTSLASQSLYAARARGIAVEPKIMARVDDYTRTTASAGLASGRGAGLGGGVGGGVIGGVPGGVPGGGVGSGRGGGAGGGSQSSVIVTSAETVSASAGVSLYKSAQELEQLSRTEEDRKKNAKQIDGIKSRLTERQFIAGFGSIGGEEFFSYLNISDSLRRSGGPEWEKWNTETKAKILKMQNNDGTWAGHHCITGRVAVTSAAILTITADREPIVNASR